jgi:hypothetical protein
MKMVLRRFSVHVVLFAAAAALTASAAYAQQGNGVVVDAAGVLRTRVVPDPGGYLTRQRLAAARATLPPDIARPSKERKVSLTRLETLVAERVATGQGITDDMRYLAGLTRIRNVFYYPETGDVVIAGPAEGYMANVAGRVVGIHTGRATLELQDLVAALRAYPPSGKKTGALVVSIDPTQEGLARMRQFLMNVGGQVTSPNFAAHVQAGLKETLGLQDVRIEGVSPRTHFAQVMLEADYRMKLIGIGLENPPVRIPSYVSKANPRSVARNALQRWYFTPDYDCVLVSQDELAMELQGDGVKLISENQFVQANGVRAATGAVDRASESFVRTFTQKYAELASKEPVYAQLRNLIDMSIAAAFIQQYDYYGKAGWNMEVFGDENHFPVETYPEPSRVETAVNAVWKGNTLMTPVGGGVNIQPMVALSSDHMKVDEEGQLEELRVKAQGEQADPNRWWWD